MGKLYFERSHSVLKKPPGNDEFCYVPGFNAIFHKQNAHGEINQTLNSQRHPITLRDSVSIKVILDKKKKKNSPAIMVPHCIQFVTWFVPCSTHDDVIKWKHFPRYWPLVRGIHRSPVDSPNKGQWRGALVFSLIYPVRLNKRLSKQ